MIWQDVSCMTLDEYCTLNDISNKTAAEELGVDKETVRLWRTGASRPVGDRPLDIYKWSKGRVQPNDFYDLPLVADKGTRQNGAGDVGGGGRNSRVSVMSHRPQHTECVRDAVYCPGGVSQKYEPCDHFVAGQQSLFAEGSP